MAPSLGLVWFGLVWFYGISTILGYLMPNPIHTYTLNIYMICEYILLDNILKQIWALFCTQLNDFKVLLYNSHNLTSVICLHTNCSIWLFDRILSGATTLGQSGLGSNGNVGVVHIAEISKAHN